MADATCFLRYGYTVCNLLYVRNVGDVDWCRAVNPAVHDLPVGAPQPLRVGPDVTAVHDDVRPVASVLRTAHLDCNARAECVVSDAPGGRLRRRAVEAREGGGAVSTGPLDPFGYNRPRTKSGSFAAGYGSWEQVQEALRARGFYQHTHPDYALDFLVRNPASDPHKRHTVDT